jgi:uncharacterized protein YdeI (YjbR/CyaY-like superfamily)
MKDPRVDAYIAKAEPFAQPILTKLRELIHKSNPEVQETIKWGMPSFDYKGPYVSMASFKQHVAFGFWLSALLDDPDGLLVEERGNGMGNLGKITSLKDLPKDKVIIDFLKQAKKLQDEGAKRPKAAPKEKEELDLPDFMAKALKKVKMAWQCWQEFSPSAQREYIEWVTEAKTEATRDKRLATTVEWVSEGKKRHWKYQK